MKMSNANTSKMKYAYKSGENVTNGLIRMTAVAVVAMLVTAETVATTVGLLLGLEIIITIIIVVDACFVINRILFRL